MVLSGARWAVLGVVLQPWERLAVIWNLTHDVADEPREAEGHRHEPGERRRVPVHLGQDEDFLKQGLDRAVADMICDLKRRWDVPVRIGVEGGDESRRVEEMSVPNLEMRAPQRRVLPSAQQPRFAGWTDGQEVERADPL